VPCCVCATRGLAASRGAYAKLGFGRLERETADEDLAQLNRRLRWWCLLFRSNSLCVGRCGHCHGLAAAALLHVVARHLASRRVVGHHASRPDKRMSRQHRCVASRVCNPQTFRATRTPVRRSLQSLPTCVPDPPGVFLRYTHGQSVHSIWNHRTVEREVRSRRSALHDITSFVKTG
jgi:hypothetical protein